MFYFDSSALVKLVVNEPESAALMTWLQPRATIVSSALTRTEVIRSILASGDAAIRRATALLGRIELLAIDAQLLGGAARLLPLTVRTLDAIHLVSAASLGEDLAALVSYDRRMLDAAIGIGLPVEAPGAAHLLS